MKKIDLHCDFIYKKMKHSSIDFVNSPSLDVTLEGLKEADYLLQLFAIYLPNQLPKTIASTLEAVSIFYDEILSRQEMMWIRSKQDLIECKLSNKIGAMLTIEGVDGLEAKLFMASIVKQLGVATVGLTWNEENWAAAGALVAEDHGLTSLGKQFVKRANNAGLLIDVSHLSQKSFYDLLDCSEKAIFASHSNCYTICEHPRNLTDHQIHCIIQTGGIIGVTYVPWFVSKKEIVNLEDVLLHIDHLLELGAENHIALGSDFDGIDSHINRLRNPADVNQLEALCLERYGYHITEKLMWKNAYQFFLNHL